MQGGQRLTTPCGTRPTGLPSLYGSIPRRILLNYLSKEKKMNETVRETKESQEEKELEISIFTDRLKCELESAEGFKEKKRLISKWYKVVEGLEDEVHDEQLEKPSKEQREVWRLLAGLKGIEEGEARELVVGSKKNMTERRNYALIMWTLAEVFGKKLEQFQPKNAPLFDRWIEGSGKGVWIVGSKNGGIRVVSGRVVVCSVGPWKERKEGRIGNWRAEENRVNGFFQVG